MKTKKVISLLLCIVILSMSLSSLIYADTEEKVSSSLNLDKKSQNILDNVAKKHDGVKAVPIDQIEELKNVDTKDFIKINSEEELEALIKALRSDQQNEDTEIVNSLSTESIVSYYEHIKWWAPASSVAAGVFCYKHIIFNYTLDGPSLTGLSEFSSYVSGFLNASSWHQNYADYSLIGDIGAEIDVDGYWILGVEIGGHPIGFTIDDVWYRTWYWD